MTDSDCPFGIFWQLYCLFFVDLLILIVPLVSFGHCIFCSSSIYWFWLKNKQWPKDTKKAMRISKSTKNRQYNGQKIPKVQAESVNRRRTDNTMAKRYQTLVSFGHCIVCSSSIYWFWLPLWYLLAIVLSVLRRFTDSDCLFGIPKDTKRAIRISKSTKNRQYNGQKIPKGQSESVNRRRTDNTMAKRYQSGNQNQSVLRRFTDSDCPFGIFWPLYCLFFVDLLILIASLVSFGHCIICSSSIYWFWLPQRGNQNQ
jgi:hypothetical protein